MTSLIRLGEAGGLRSMGKDPGLLFGAIALQAGHLTRERLDELLEEQAAAPTPLPLGELCLKRGALSANQVRRILRIQRAVELTQEDMRLGTLAVKNGFAREEDIRVALEAQQKEGPSQKSAAERLGEILLAMGTLSSQRLKALLAAQARLRNGTVPEEDDLGTETKELELPPPAAPTPQEPRAWLLLEGSTGRTETCPLGRFATLGRMPSHEIPVPDMGASRTHARIEFSEEVRRHVVTDLDSRNGTFVNGDRIAQPRILSPGDVIRVGEAVFRYAVGDGVSMEAPSPPAPATGEPAEAAPEAPPEQVSWRVKVVAALEAVRQLASRVAPGVHPARQLVAFLAWVGMIAAFLPWARRPDGSSALGIQGAGAGALVLFAATLVLALLGDRSRPAEGRALFAILAASGLVSLLGVIKLVLSARDPQSGGRFGLYLATLAGAAITLAIWIRRDSRVSAPLPDAKRLWGSVKGAAAKAGGTTVRIFSSITGKREREKVEAIRTREVILRQVGEAARRAGISSEEAAAVVTAEQEVEASRRRSGKAQVGGPSREAMLAARALKNAELRLERSLQRLGRSVIDRGVTLEEERSRIAEILVLDQRVKELS